MKIKLVNVEKKEKNILNNLLQLYLHEISFYFPIQFDSLKGEYQYENLDIYFNNQTNKAYFIKADLDIIGFLLINKEEDTNIIQEIFVLNNYKNKGIGEKAVVLLIKEGKWLIKSLPNSLLAEKFWDKTISKITNGNYLVEHIGKYERAVYRFEIKNMGHCIY